GLLDHFQGVAVLLADHVHGAVHDLLGDGLLAALHDHVDEAGDDLASVLGIGQDRTLGSIAFTRHDSVFLRPSGAWRRTWNAPACAWRRRRRRASRARCGNARRAGP